MSVVRKHKVLSLITSACFGVVFLLGLQGCGGGSSSPSVSIGGATVTEGDSGTQTLIFTVTTSAAAGANASVTYATADGTALAGSDYTAKTGTLVIPSGSSSATITVDVTGDTAFEFDETLILTLSAPSGLALGTDSSATGTITDDDDADTRGYFTGSAAVNSASYTDITGIAHNGRLMVFSPTANVLYDIDIDTVTGTDFTGTVDVYANGNILMGNITVSGTTNESQVQGAFGGGGTGFQVGSFDILFDTQNNRGATLSRISTNNVNQPGSFFGYATDTGIMRVSTVGGYAGGDDGDPSCGFLSNYTLPDSAVNIYDMAHNITDSLNCAFLPSTAHTGLASVVDTTSTDDTIVFAFANGIISLFGTVNK